MTAPDGEGTYGVYGDHTQNAIGNHVSRDLIQHSYLFVRGRPSLSLGPSEIEETLRCHVPANNHDLIVKMLEADHAVILAGPPGSGRKTAAIAAIRRLHPGASIRRFSLEDDDVEEIQVRGGGYLVDATGGQARLAGCVDAVRSSRGYLVVIADGAAPDPAPVNLNSITIDPPHAVQVYRHRATVRGLVGWRYWDEAPKLLQDARPADARRLTDLIEQLGGRDGDIAARRGEVAHAYQGWNEELRGWFAAHREPHERALMIAATALSPYAEEMPIYSTASTLAERLQITMNGTGLAWCPVTGLSALLGADHKQGRFVFRKLGFAASTLRHALTDYPLARSGLLSWLAMLPTDDAVPGEARISLAETFADMVAAYGPGELITETARKWGAAGHADLAFTALYRTCVDARVGGSVRRAMYTWSRKSRLPQTLKLVIARVCEPLGQTYLSVALTRLKHLATHGDRQVLTEVLAAARALAASGDRAEVFAAALAWCAEANSERLSPTARQSRRRAGATLFLELARPLTESGLPQVLDGDQAVAPTSCEPGWQAVLNPLTGFGISETSLDDVAHRWLDAALHHQRVRAGIVRVFIDAAMPSQLSSGIPYSMGTRTHGPTAAKIMIDVARRWVALDRTDPIRKQIKEAIVIPLTHPWWLRLLKILHVQLRTLIATTRQST